LEYACDWDNSGLQVGDWDQVVDTVYLALDPTDEAIEAAGREGAQLLLTHHPLLFSGLKQVTTDSLQGGKVIALIRQGTASYAMHTNYDICAMADLINNDPDMRGRLKVVYLEDYNVSMAEALMPAADVSEQISLAGTEASGTGNMKLMLNGAVTLGTMDGANIEIHEAVGEENIVIFGMKTPEVNALKPCYNPHTYYENNPEIHKVVDFINKGINGKMFPDVSASLIYHDPYMVLADFADYQRAQKKVRETFLDQKKWNQMSLLNIAYSGRFAADRAINEYARNIWNTQKM
jgi:glycogen/starch/alpha-glucan phosphorylase-like protein